MNRLRAAAGVVDLRPVVGAPLTGFGSRLGPSTGCHDPLLARLMLLDDNSSRLVWVSCDLIGISPEDDATLRGRIADKLSVAPAHVLVSCTHTHSGPASMPFRGPLGQVDAAWLARTFDAIAAEAAALAARLRPARVAHGTETVTGLGYNRQDGVSPIDERLLVVQFTGDDDGRAIATILNYATHPVVLGEHNLMFTADYPGYAAGFVERALGGAALFVQGSAGDVDPVVYRDVGRGAGTFEIAEEMGRTLADAATAVIERAEPQADVSIATSDQRVDLPLDAPPALDEVRAMKADLFARRGPVDADPQTDDARWAMFQLAWAEQLERAIEHNAVPRTLSVRLFAARVGDVYAVTFPLEIYSQIGLDVREQFAPHPVVIAAYTNGLLGYAPTDRAIAQGGYGPAGSYRFFPHLLTPLARGTDPRLVRAATELVNALGSH
jgi:hypothetical protein